MTHNTAFLLCTAFAFVATSAVAQNGPGLASVHLAGNNTYRTILSNPGDTHYGYPNGVWLTGDLNGDGREDAVHAVQGTDYVHPWLSNGDGTFTVTWFSPWEGYRIPNGIWRMADVNGDRRADIVHAVTGTNYIHTWLSNGDGSFHVTTFRAWDGYAIPAGDWHIGDFNGDRRQDLLHVVSNKDYVHTWLSNGDGTFHITTFQPWKGYVTTSGILRVGDLDGDGRSDIFHAVGGRDYAHTWLSNGDGSFNVGTFQPWAGYGIPNGEWLVGDIDADGRSDIIHAVANTDYIHTWHSRGNGAFEIRTFRPWQGYAISNGQWLLGDINADQRMDLIHVIRNADYFNTWSSNGDGTFSITYVRPWIGYPIGPVPAKDRPWLIFDVNGDKRADLMNFSVLRPARSLRIARHSTASLTEAEADSILKSMAIIAFRNDNETDVTCPIQFTRNGQVTTFQTGTGTLNSDKEVNNILKNVAGEVKVVSAINYCGSVKAGIVGCAPSGGEIVHSSPSLSHTRRRHLAA